ncbi:hypothetical protein ACIQTX_18680 [Microbacterium sp. NPDC090281]|uniref:hypothetical protein n=1 Tax=Microbacterium sp. NPDC090281 TaxID=3364208 RepID=UPI00380B1DAD
MSEPAGVVEHGLFVVDVDVLLAGVRHFATGGGGSVDANVVEVLEDARLLEAGSLTPEGITLFRTAWVSKQRDAALRALGQALRATLPVQVISQELNSYGPVHEDGVRDLLAHHRILPPDKPVDLIRRTFKMLNTLGIAAYSSKLKTVRFIPDDPAAAKAGEQPDLATMISPRTPFSNVAKLRRVLRAQSGIVTWADQHFGARAFEELVDELDPTKVAELRIISGNASNVASPKSFKDYERFRDEMGMKGIIVEWRVDGTREWHDRWLVDEKTVYNVPPVNSLFANQYSEILPTKERPPVDEWWARATPRAE